MTMGEYNLSRFLRIQIQFEYIPLIHIMQRHRYPHSTMIHRLRISSFENFLADKALSYFDCLAVQMEREAFDLYF